MAAGCCFLPCSHPSPLPEHPCQGGSLRSHGGCPGGSTLALLPLLGQWHPRGRCIGLAEGRRGRMEPGAVLAVGCQRQSLPSSPGCGGTMAMLGGSGSMGRRGGHPIPSLHRHPTPGSRQGQCQQCDGCRSITATMSGGWAPCGSPGAGHSSGCPQVLGRDQEWGWPGRGCSALLATSGVTGIWQPGEITFLCREEEDAEPWLTPSAPQEAVPPASRCLVAFEGSDGFPHVHGPILWYGEEVSVPRAWGDPSCPGTHWQRDGSARLWCLLHPHRSLRWGCFPRGSDARGLLAMPMLCQPQAWEGLSCPGLC